MNDIIKISTAEFDKLVPFGNNVVIKWPNNEAVDVRKSGLVLFKDPGMIKMPNMDDMFRDHSKKSTYEEFDKSAMLQRRGFIVKQPEKLKYDTGGMPHLLWWDTDIETKVGDEVWFDYQSALQADVLVVSESGKSLPGENLDYYWVFSYQFLIVAKRQEQTIMLNGYILFLQVNEGLQSKWLELPKYINKTKGVVKYVGSSNREYHPSRDHLGRLIPNRKTDHDVMVDVRDHIVFRNNVECLLEREGYYHFSPEPLRYSQRCEIYGVTKN